MCVYERVEMCALHISAVYHCHRHTHFTLARVLSILFHHGVLCRVKAAVDVATTTKRISSKRCERLWFALFFCIFFLRFGSSYFFAIVYIVRLLYCWRFLHWSGTVYFHIEGKHFHFASYHQPNCENDDTSLFFLPMHLNRRKKMLQKIIRTR